jgi:hypothetical protein
MPVNLPRYQHQGEDPVNLRGLCAAFLEENRYHLTRLRNHGQYVGEYIRDGLMDVVLRPDHLFDGWPGYPALGLHRNGRLSWVTSEIRHWTRQGESLLIRTDNSDYRLDPVVSRAKPKKRSNHAKKPKAQKGKSA